jgi:hypothetical protein
MSRTVRSSDGIYQQKEKRAISMGTIRHNDFGGSKCIVIELGVTVQEACVSSINKVTNKNLVKS